MTEEVKAEIAARTAEKQQQQAQVNITIGGSSPEQMKGLNEKVGSNRDEAQAILQGAFMFQNFLQQLGVKTPQEALQNAQQGNQN